MIRSMYTAITSMLLHQQYLDATSDNLANVNTPGFKASKTMFQDLYSQLQSPGSAPTGVVGGINPTQVGLGLKLGYISPVFTQGTLNSTGRTSDLAIQGEGLFIYKNGEGKRSYSREASLQIDSEGYLVNASTGLRMQGWNAQVGQVPDIDPNWNTNDLKINLQKSVAASTSVIELTGNLKSSTDVLAPADITNPAGMLVPPYVGQVQVAPSTIGTFANVNALPFPSVGANSKTDYYDVTVGYYDSLGNEKTTSVRFTRIWGDGTATSIDPYGPIDGVDTPETVGTVPLTYANTAVPVTSMWAMSIAPNNSGTLEIGPYTGTSEGANARIPYDNGADGLTGTPLCTVMFDDQGQVRRVNGVPTSAVTERRPDNANCALPVIRIPGTNGASQTTFSFDVTNLSQLYSTLDTNTVSLSYKDGVAPGAVTDIHIAQDSGEVYVLFSNGQREKMGAIGMARFTNPSGLLRTGSSMYLEGVNSGAPQIGLANTSGRGTISPGYLEGSNVDMGQEFTNVILAQRGFQAATRMIRTGDEVLTELVNLKR